MVWTEEQEKKAQALKLIKIERKTNTGEKTTKATSQQQPEYLLHTYIFDAQESERKHWSQDIAEHLLIRDKTYHERDFVAFFFSLLLLLLLLFDVFVSSRVVGVVVVLFFSSLFSVQLEFEFGVFAVLHKYISRARVHVCEWIWNLIRSSSLQVIERVDRLFLLLFLIFFAVVVVIVVVVEVILFTHIFLYTLWIMVCVYTSQCCVIGTTTQPGNVHNISENNTV